MMNSAFQVKEEVIMNEGYFKKINEPQCFIENGVLIVDYIKKLIPGEVERVKVNNSLYEEFSLIF
ncbi:hypothetical protein P8625_13655 [Tenacibaculum tangerinum]|uniref:Uncharacterized protein n=1 Tax=Tenacibaculum tangerinum TaxID=3038772 RepID=A0ABY8L4Z5_9FLAO|nr:hypothetical protein [Tenacibaculum tangerinum]WGH75104.1 hypothetical protein P8625_13655 [Tenacibaculum tangerinum]